MLWANLLNLLFTEKIGGMKMEERYEYILETDMDRKKLLGEVFYKSFLLVLT